MRLEELKKPFPSEEVEWRVQTTGKGKNGPWAMLLPYVTNRAIQNRLDTVVGPANWKNEFAPAPTGGIMCGLSIRIGDEWITKWDAAQETAVEPIKGGFSDAMKRAAVQWGIGRYLYYLDFQVVPVLSTRPEGRYIRVDDRSNKISGYAKVPSLPAWALPGAEPKQADRPAQDKPEGKSAEPKPEPAEGPPLEGITYRRQGNLVIAEGNTFAMRGLLKNAGFRWSNKARAWAKEAA